jgi:hypothetical protein
MADNENILSSTRLKVNDSAAFADAEPYHYGTGSPTAGYFTPIGEDNDATTTDLKIQAPENNSYSTIKKILGFKINNKDIQYIKAGTFPLPQHLISFEGIGHTGFGDTGWTDLSLQIDYSSDKTIHTISIKSDQENFRTILFDKESKSGLLYKERKHGNEDAPERLGFILVGGGGGAGGGGRYDVDKDQKGSAADYVIPGGGGGGGEIVYGVLDISYATMLKLREKAWKYYNTPDKGEPPSTFPTDPGPFHSLYYTITLGRGGEYGSHNTDSGAASGGHDGWDGDDGESSHISSQFRCYDTDSDGNLTTNLTSFYGGTLVHAYGGQAGKGAKNFQAGSGGAGGDGSNIRKPSQIIQDYNCAVKAIAGGKGGHPNSTNSHTVEIPGLNFDIYFSNTTVPDTYSKFSKYCLRRTHDPISITYSTDANTDISVFDTPGGHSFGAGNTKTTKENKGGGGACVSDSRYRYGSAGFFGLYY